MAQLSSFMFISLNGYYKAPGDDISWHRHDAEESKYSEESVQAGNILLFGRTTYEMMASFWPTEIAKTQFPVIAEGMNKAEKIVFSTTLQQAAWNNTSIVHSNMIETVHKLKQTSGKNMTLLGSGSILSQLTSAGLVDNYLVMIDPVAIGQGTTVFNGIDAPLNLQLTASRVFKSGVVLLEYKPV